MHAEVLVEPLVVRLKEVFQPPPGGPVHFLLVKAFVRDLPSSGLPVWQVEEIQYEFQDIGGALVEMMTKSGSVSGSGSPAASHSLRRSSFFN